MSLFSKNESSEGRDAGKARKGGSQRYGIAEATLLMRTLPVDQNVELVVRVIRQTLESTNVLIDDIIGDAIGKEKELEARRDVLNTEITELSKQIEQRKQEITRLDAELSETTTVKDRLILAQKLGSPKVPTPAVNKGSTPPAPPAAVMKMNGKAPPELRLEAR